MTAEPAYSNIRPADLPAPPQSALQIMRACAQEVADNRQIATIVNNDPVLTAELLRVVNSPYFGIGKEVKNIAFAITVLGHKALRNIVLCISVKDALAKHTIQGFDVSEYWEDAIRRAVAARQMAGILNLDSEDCFTAGLLQDFGMLILFHLHPDKASNWPVLRAQTPTERYQFEQQDFAATHDKVLGLLAETWKLPEDLSAMLRFHHELDNPKAESVQQYCRVLYAADWLTAVYSTSDSTSILERVFKEVGSALALEREQIESVLESMPALVGEAATALGLRISRQPDYEEVIKQANVRLAEANLSYQELTWRLNKALQDRDRYAAELNRELTLAQEIQQNLLPVSNPKKLPIQGINIPAKILSGDFFDYLVASNGSLYFTLADVSGKGITAALLMAKACSLFHCLARDAYPLTELLARINKEICETSIRGMFVTMIAGCYDPKTDKVTIVNAGHIPGLLVKPDLSMVEVPAQGPPLGVLSALEFKAVSFSLKQNSFYAFTDGITEYKLDNGDMLEVDGLIEILKSNAKLAPADRIESIVSKITQSGELAQDDITLLLLERRDG